MIDTIYLWHCPFTRQTNLCTYRNGKRNLLQDVSEKTVNRANRIARRLADREDWTIRPFTVEDCIGWTATRTKDNGR